MEKQHKIAIFTSAINVESRMKFLGAWRHILRNMFEHMKINLDMSNIDVLKHIIRDQYDKVELILDIFGFTTNDLQSDKYNEYKKLRSQLMQTKIN